MNSIDFYSLDPQEKRVFFNSLAEKTGMTPFAVEKDWWVSTTLNLVFRQPDASYMVLKGGTSLSKAWGLIQRFSEDLDFVLDGKRFGFHGELGKNQRDIRFLSKHLKQLFRKLVTCRYVLNQIVNQPVIAIEKSIFSIQTSYPFRVIWSQGFK
jgi:predicted nucleotidyltransferase component of viral defense system